MAEIYFSGQGTVYVGTRDGNGNAKKLRDVGNVPTLQITLETDVMEHKESRTGQRLTDLRITRERRARISMTLESWTKDNLMMLLYGDSQTLPVTAVTNEAFPSGLAVGDIVQLNNSFIEDSPTPTIVDSAGTPANLVAGTNYKLDKNSGLVTILNLGTFVQPFKANYTPAAATAVPMFREQYQERFLKFVGLNTANADKPVVVDLYRVVFDPVGNLDLITDEMAQYQIEGSVLYDSARDADATLGGFGRIVQTSYLT